MKTESESKNPKDTKPTDKAWELRLYVAGHTPKSITAFANLKKICEEHLKGKYHIEVIDLLKNPHLPRETRSSQFRPWSENFPSP